MWQPHMRRLLAPLVRRQALCVMVDIVHPANLRTAMTSQEVHTGSVSVDQCLPLKLSSPPTRIHSAGLPLTCMFNAHNRQMHR